MDRIPLAARFPAPVQTGAGTHPASCTMSTGSFSGVKSGRSVRLTGHPLLAPWTRKSRAIPLIPLRAVRPVQSLSACTRVHFTFLPFFPQEQSSRSVKLTNHFLQVPKLRNLSDVLKIPAYYFMGWLSVKKRDEFHSLRSTGFAWYTLRVNSISASLKTHTSTQILCRVW